MKRQLFLIIGLGEAELLVLKFLRFLTISELISQLPSRLCGQQAERLLPNKDRLGPILLALPFWETWLNNEGKEESKFERNIILVSMWRG